MIDSKDQSIRGNSFMTIPDPGHQEPKVLPGYFSPATTPPQYVQPPVPAPPAPGHREPQFQQPLNPSAQMPSPVQPYAAPPMQYGAGPYAAGPFGASDPESLPLQNATLFQSVGRFFRKYATFSGRASRAEFWFVQLFMMTAFFALVFVGGIFNVDAAAWLIIMGWFGTVVPWLALAVRRLHDANLSGGLVALWFVPYVGFAVVLVLALLAAKPEGVRFDKRAVAPAPYGQAPHGRPQF